MKIQFLTLCSVLILVIMSSCDRSKDGAEAEAAPSSITIYSWEDYLVPELLEQFTEETGIEVNVESFGTIDEMTDRLKSNPGQYDVLICDDPGGTSLQDLRLVRELDREKLPGFANLDPAYLDLAADPGNKYSVPYFWGTTVVAYNTKKIPDPEHSWSLLWDKDLAGRVMMYGEKYELFSMGLLQSGCDPAASNEEHLKAVTDTLTTQVVDVRGRFGDDADVRAGLIDEEIWAAMMYSGDAVYIGEDNPDVDFFVPNEGTKMWVDSFFIARDSTKVDAGHTFIDFMLRPEVAAESSNYYFYATPNREAIPLVDEELVADERIYLPAEQMERSAFHSQFSPEFEKEVTKMVRDLLRLASAGAATAAAP